jgi:hypothetical protein
MYTRKISRRSYSRKLETASSDYTTVSIPSTVADIWSNASSVAICYDSDLNVLIMTPITGDQNVIS